MRNLMDSPKYTIIFEKIMYEELWKKSCAGYKITYTCYFTILKFIQFFHIHHYAIIHLRRTYTSEIGFIFRNCKF